MRRDYQLHTLRRFDQQLTYQRHGVWMHSKLRFLDAGKRGRFRTKENGEDGDEA